jgi:hypothetical protein
LTTKCEHQIEWRENKGINAARWRQVERPMFVAQKDNSKQVQLEAIKNGAVVSTYKHKKKNEGVEERLEINSATKQDDSQSWLHASGKRMLLDTCEGIQVSSYIYPVIHGTKCEVNIKINATANKLTWWRY